MRCWAFQLNLLNIDPPNSIIDKPIYALSSGGGGVSHMRRSK